jgi:hypothetical protein
MDVKAPTAERLTPAEAEGLAAIRSGRKWVWRWLLTGVPLACIGILLPERASRISASLWIAGGVWLTIRRELARCPRCQRHFNGSWKSMDPFAQYCRHCGLALPRESSRSEPGHVNG